VPDVDMDRQQVLSTDQLRLEVDAFARYRIVDSASHVHRARDEEPLRDQR
jgi:membrane protease subunit HflC